MAIDTTTPRSRRAVIAGAVGGVLASFGLLAKAPDVRAGTDGDLVLEATNNTDAHPSNFILVKKHCQKQELREHHLCLVAFYISPNILALSHFNIHCQPR